VQYGVMHGDGETVTVTGTDTPRHSGRWLAAVTLRSLRRETWRGPGDAAAQIVTRSMTTTYGPWQVLGDETTEPSPELSPPVENPVESALTPESDWNALCPSCRRRTRPDSVTTGTGPCPDCTPVGAP
jgi:hypothetical protein